MLPAIVIIGLGYVGLTTASCLADCGFKVRCIDKNPNKINKLRSGIIPIYEPDLAEKIIKNLEEGRLYFSTDFKNAVENAKIIFVAVGTPLHQDGSVNVQMVESVVYEISQYLNGYKLVVIKSTVPVGTTRRLSSIITNSQLQDHPFDIVFNPEFLREGTAIWDFLHPDRIIIGSENEESTVIIKNIYQTLKINDVPFMITGLETAELIKYASNAFLALKISFINEMANLCERLGANVSELAIGIGSDHRIGLDFLNPGPGYGGGCLPKDTKALTRIARDAGAQLQLVETTILVNQLQKDRVVQKIRDVMGNLAGKSIAILGLAFKPNTDDIREAPALDIISDLLEYGAHIRAYDPEAMEMAQMELESPGLTFGQDEYETARGANALVILTEWNQFKILDMSAIKQILIEPYLFDMRNIYEPCLMKDMGFNYFSIGR